MVFQFLWWFLPHRKLLRPILFPKKIGCIIFGMRTEGLLRSNTLPLKDYHGRQRCLNEEIMPTDRSLCGWWARQWGWGFFPKLFLPMVEELAMILQEPQEWMERIGEASPNWCFFCYIHPAWICFFDEGRRISFEPLAKSFRDSIIVHPWRSWTSLLCRVTNKFRLQKNISLGRKPTKLME